MPAKNQEPAKTEADKEPKAPEANAPKNAPDASASSDPAGATDKPKAESKPAVKRDFVRVVCTRENAGTVINGIGFATVVLADERVHVSERLGEDRAASLLRVPGFTVWDGDEDEHARTIEDALRANAAAVVGTPQAAVAKEALELDELRASNRRLAADLTAARQQNEEQAETIRQLRDEIERLKERGGRAA